MTKPEKIEDVTKGSVSQTDFLSKVGPDEPVFILRGRDALAIPTIDAWIQQARLRGVSPTKIGEATAHLEMFMKWQNWNPTRLPD